MPFLPLALISLAWTVNAEESTYVRDFSKPAPMLPQTQPFIQYTRPAYDFNITSDEAAVLNIEGKKPKQWWAADLNGMKVGGPILAAEAPFGRGANLLRSAIGLKFWSGEVGDSGWAEKSDRMVRLFLSQTSEGKVPIAFNFRTKSARFGTFEQGGFASAVWLHHMVEAHPESDYAAQAQEFIDRAVAAALKADSTSVDAAWLLAEAADGRLSGEDHKLAMQKVLAALKSSRADEPDAIRLAGAASQMNGGSEFSEVMTRFASPILTKSGLRNGVILDGYVYAGRDPDIWQDAALAEMELGARLDNPVQFESGAKMVRATLTDFSTPGLVGNNLLSPRGMMDGRAANGDFGRSFAPQDKGFTDGEGQTLATLGMSHERFGSVFFGRSGWGVGIDGIILVGKTPFSGLSLNPTSYDSLFPTSIKRFGQSNSEPAGQAPLMTAIREIFLEFRDNQTLIVARPNPVQLTGLTPPSGVFITASGTRLTANPGPDGFETSVVASDLAGPISFEGSLGAAILKAKGASTAYAPRLSSSAAWQAMGPMGDFSSEPGALSTKGDPSRWGELRSDAFSGPHKSLAFDWEGDGEVAIEVWDLDQNQKVRSTPLSTRKGGAMTMDVSALATQRLQIRVVDNDPKGWIQVRNFKLK